MLTSFNTRLENYQATEAAQLGEFHDAFKITKNYANALRINFLANSCKQSICAGEENAGNYGSAAIAASIPFFKEEIKLFPNFHEQEDMQKINSIQGFCIKTLADLPDYEYEPYNKKYHPTHSQRLHEDKKIFKYKLEDDDDLESEYD